MFAAYAVVSSDVEDRGVSDVSAAGGGGLGDCNVFEIQKKSLITQKIHVARLGFFLFNVDFN